MITRYLFSTQDLSKISAKFDDLLYWITYLDACSLGKTSDFENSLSKMSELVSDLKKLLNKGSALAD